MQHIAFNYGVSKTAIWKSIRWTEDILIKRKAFSLPSKRKLSVKAVNTISNYLRKAEFVLELKVIRDLKSYINVACLQ